MAGIVPQLHQLFICHAIYIGIIWIRLGILFRFFDCSLEQSFFFSPCLASSSTVTKCHHEHLSFIYSIFDLSHMHRHLQLGHHRCISVHFTSCSPPLHTIRVCSHCNHISSSRPIFLFIFSGRLSIILILVVFVFFELPLKGSDLSFEV